MAKNYIESVTNLKREKKLYVPKEMYDRTLGDLFEVLIRDCDSLEEQKEVEAAYDATKHQAEESAKEFYTIDDDKKSDISVCPYCGGMMTLTFIDSERRSRYYRSYSPIRGGGDALQYECMYCGATSPKTHLRITLVDEAETKKNIKEEIGRAIDEINREQEGYDDEE